MSKKLPPVHPGEVLREDFMVPTGTSINKLALDLHVAPSRILEIVKGKRAITADTALRLAQYLGTTPDFWLGLQMQYDLERAQDELSEKIQGEVRRRAA
jgi:addiction module HigA family antidote